MMTLGVPAPHLWVTLRIMTKHDHKIITFHGIVQVYVSPVTQQWVDIPWI